MAVHLEVSHSLFVLSDYLVEDLDRQPKDVFRPVYLITQTEGMNTWLKYRIAERHGIAANYKYLKSQDIINQIYFLLGGRFSDLLSEDNLPWILFKLLGEKDFIDKYPDVAGYYASDDSNKEVKQMALAEKTADLFDQYQIYRQEMIEEWNQNPDNTNTNEWQEYLWKKTKLLLNEKLPDKTNISKYILAQLENESQQIRLRERIPVVYLFGLSITTEYHLRIYHAIARYCEVKFLMINPAPGQYWFEDLSPKQMAILERKGCKNIQNSVAGNPLLTNWGKLLQDTFNLFFSDENMINAYNELPASAPGSQTLLEKLQNDIYHNHETAFEPDEISLADGSLIINNCFNPAREVEVLYNYLVSLVDKRQKKLSPRDIVVMVSDINLYAPYIKAVFDNAPYRFAYGIADETYVTGDTISSALESLLSLSEENFTSENVLQLLDSAHVRKRFGINNISLIREAVNLANIRFGIENNLDDESVYVSWRYGLKRIMMGICMGDEEEYGSGPYSFFPIDIAEGTMSEQLIRFCYFVDVLIEMVEEKKAARTIDGWTEFMISILDNLIVEPEQATEEEYITIIKNLEEYKTLSNYFADTLSFAVFSHHYLKSLHSLISEGSFVSEGITFCSLIPMRSIPFKVVALLGMSFDMFPRKENPVSFNLIEKNKKKGDRNIKGNDKHLFLETILSAQENLYISYIGQSTKDNTSIPPSILVDELIDYIQSGTKAITDVRNLLVKKHPLHNFSRYYNKKDERLYNYLVEKKQHTPAIVDPNKNTAPFSFEEIQLKKLIRFFANPFKGYYNNVLDIYYNDEEVLINEDELFELDHLERFSLKHQILNLEPGKLSGLRDELVKKGRLPMKNIGSLLLNDSINEIEETIKNFNGLVLQNKPVCVPIEIPLTSTVIRGNIDRMFGDRVVNVSFSSNEQKVLQEAYIQWLALKAAGHSCSLYFISHKKNKTIAALDISSAEAKDRLEKLVQLYQKGHEKILAYYPSFDIKPGDLNKLDAGGLNAAIEKKLNNYKTPYEDKYIMSEYKKGFFNRTETLNEYKNCAFLLLQPLEEIFADFFKNK